VFDAFIGFNDVEYGSLDSTGKFPLLNINNIPFKL